MNFYDGSVRVVTPRWEGVEQVRAEKYLDNIAEHVEPWSYIKFCYLKPLGWKGFTEGADSGVYAWPHSRG